MDMERLMKRQPAVRIGGRGTVRRKKQAGRHRTTATDKEEHQRTIPKELRKFGAGLKERVCKVNIYKDDKVIQLRYPPTAGANEPSTNTWLVSETPQTKKLDELELGGGADNPRKERAELLNQASGLNANASSIDAKDDEDEVPELIPGKTFETTGEEGHAS